MEHIAPEITVELAIAAYQKTGFEPVQDHFFLEESGGMCACLVGVLYAACGNELENIVLDAGKAETFAHQRYGRSYANGMISGFDGSEFNENNSESWQNGHRKGREIWEGVKHLIKEETE
ncbi:hypothetical protein [Paenibacillus sp. MMO-58]|uniref:hypothetical protein n=1 Tax=Paenibacillus sp. MMO-58 TaxID=3081290 RepID=UPI0030188A1A